MTRTGAEPEPAEPEPAEPESAQSDERRSSRLRRIAITVLGAVVLVAGLVMLVLPGPGALVIVAGLAVLASEYAWAQRWLDTVRHKAQASAEKSAASRLSVAFTLVGAAFLLAAAAVCFTDSDFGIPLVAKVSSPLTGVLLAASAVLVVALTLGQRRKLVARARVGEGPLARG